MNFFVPGLPKPQGSKRAFVVKGRPVLAESAGQPLKDWRAVVALAAMNQMAGSPPLDGPVLVRLGFYLPRPKSHPKTKITYPTSRPDIDKLARSVLDALTHICFSDDAQVVHLEARKWWADGGNSVGVGISVMPCLWSQHHPGAGIRRMEGEA